MNLKELLKVINDSELVIYNKNAFESETFKNKCNVSLKYTDYELYLYEVLNVKALTRECLYITIEKEVV